MLDLFMPTYDHRWVNSPTAVTEDDVAEAVANLVAHNAPAQWSHRYCMVAALSRSTLPRTFMDAGMDIDSAHVAAHYALDCAVASTFSDPRLSLTLIKEVCEHTCEAQALTELSVLALHAVEAQLLQGLALFKDYFFEEALNLNTTLSFMDSFLTSPMTKPLSVEDEGFRQSGVAAAIQQRLA